MFANSSVSHHVMLPTGQSEALQSPVPSGLRVLGLSRHMEVQSAWVSSVRCIQNAWLRVTGACSSSWSPRPGSVGGEPMTKEPAETSTHAPGAVTPVGSTTQAWVLCGCDTTFPPSDPASPGSVAGVEE